MRHGNENLEVPIKRNFYLKAYQGNLVKIDGTCLINSFSEFLPNNCYLGEDISSAQGRQFYYLTV